jgi:hypothetical protein
MLSRSCIEKMRRSGTLLNIAIFCITLGRAGLLGAARDDVRLDARLHELLDAELGGLGLLLAQCRGLDDVRERDEAADPGPSSKASSRRASM